MHKTAVLILILFLTAACSNSRNDDEKKIYSLTACSGTVYSVSEDGTQSDMSAGLPETVQVLQFFPYEDGSVFCSTMSSGLFLYKDGLWHQLLNDTFKRRTMIENVDEYRKVSAFARSKVNPMLMAVAQKHALYLSRDGGNSWNEVQNIIRAEDYITSLALDNSDRLWIGTSYNGVFVLDGDLYENRSDGLYFEPYAGDVVFYETVAHLEEVNGTMYASMLFNKGLYAFSEKRWIREEINGSSPVFYVQDIAATTDGLVASAQSMLYTKQDGTWVQEADTQVPNQQTCTAVLGYYNGVRVAARHHLLDGTKRNSTQKTAAGKKAIYTNIHMLKKNIDGLINVIKQSGLNALVIDVKDDYGDVLAHVTSDKAGQVGALSRSIDFLPYLKRLHDEDIYVIARMVVFKDKRLFRAFDGKYAIWDSKHDRPWRANNREYWCDPHSEFVRSYNIELAEAAAEIGFDEIQFDYIRFPADGPLERCEYRYRKDADMFKSEVLDDFLQEARRRISVPISVDIYGFTAFYNFGNRIGQDIEIFGKHVDAVSAMIYPSHYGYRFYMKGPREERPYRIVYDTGIRSRFLSNDSAIMRPYLQAFDMKSPTFGPGYITYQVRAADESGCDGYVFWHAGGSYGVVRRALSQE